MWDLTEGEAGNYFKWNCYEARMLNMLINFTLIQNTAPRYIQMIWVGSLCDRVQRVSIMNVCHVSGVLDWQQWTDFLDSYFNPFGSQLLLWDHPASKCLALFTLGGQRCCPISVALFWVSCGCSRSSYWDHKRSGIQCGLKLELCYQSSGIFAGKSCMLWPYLSVGILLLMYTTHSSVFTGFLTVSCGLDFSIYTVSLSLTLYKVSYYYCLGAFIHIPICVSFRLILNLSVTNFYTWQMREC